MDEFARVNAILRKAVEYKTLSKRATFVERECAGDSMMLTAVLALLRELDSEKNSKLDPAGGTLNWNSCYINGDANPRGTDELPERQRFCDFELIKEIARDEMSVVFKARQVSLNRIVALKILRARVRSGDEEKRQFRAEVEAVGILDHPNIVPVHEAGSHRRRHYFTMKWMEGGSLAGSISELTRDPKMYVSILVRVAKAIHFAHQHGILHRRLKPTNILFDAQGGTLVSDFGLAMHSRQEVQTRIAESRAALRAQEYFSPEQAAGEVEHLTAASDIYSMGVIFYEILTGHVPFEATSSREFLKRLQNEEPISPRIKNPLADHDLETICLKCLEKAPTKRYASAEDLALDLERWLRREPILAQPANPIARVIKWAKRGTTLYWVRNLTARSSANPARE